MLLPRFSSAFPFAFLLWQLGATLSLLSGAKAAAAIDDRCVPLDYTASMVYHFPGDFGAHLDQKLEWWWMMGALQTTTGLTFGVGIFLTRFQMTCGPKPWLFAGWTAEFTIMDPNVQGNGSHIYVHLPGPLLNLGMLPYDSVSLTNNYTAADRRTDVAMVNGGECELIGGVSEMCSSRVQPPLRIVGNYHNKTDGTNKEFYRFAQNAEDPSLFEFSATGLGVDEDNLDQSTVWLKGIKFRDVHGAQPISSSGMITVLTQDNLLTSTIELDQTRLKVINEPGDEPELRIGNVTHKIRSGLFYNSHQWLNNATSNNNSWIWFWFGLDDAEETTIVVNRLPPYSQHIAANVISVNVRCNDGPQRHNRVYAGSHDIIFNASHPWTSPRSGFTYYTKHYIRILPAGLELHIESITQDAEFGYKAGLEAYYGNLNSAHSNPDSTLFPKIFYYEGVSRVWGTKQGKPVTGWGNIETYRDFYTYNPPHYPTF